MRRRPALTVPLPRSDLALGRVPGDSSAVELQIIPAQADSIQC